MIGDYYWIMGRVIVKQHRFQDFGSFNGVLMGLNSIERTKHGGVMCVVGFNYD